VHQSAVEEEERQRTSAIQGARRRAPFSFCPGQWRQAQCPISGECTR
jgi:hypothetical protein